jgi:hypothetical protein
MAHRDTYIARINRVVDHIDAHLAETLGPGNACGAGALLTLALDSPDPSTRFSGTALDIHAAWQGLFAHWLPDSGWQADDRPSIELYDQGADTGAPDGSFTCLLCVPVRAL